jgi:hypothetical protein
MVLDVVLGQNCKPQKARKINTFKGDIRKNETRYRRPS